MAELQLRLAPREDIRIAGDLQERWSNAQVLVADSSEREDLVMPEPARYNPPPAAGFPWIGWLFAAVVMLGFALGLNAWVAALS